MKELNEKELEWEISKLFERGRFILKNMGEEGHYMYGELQDADGISTKDELCWKLIEKVSAFLKDPEFDSRLEIIRKNVFKTEDNAGQ